MQEKMKLYGLAEFAAALGWDRRKFSTYRKRGVMPEPYQELASGPIWTEEQVQAEIARRVPGTPMPLHERITLAERIAEEHGLEVLMTAQEKHGHERYSGPPRAYMADRHWALYARCPESGLMQQLGDRLRPPTETKIRRAVAKLEQARRGRES